MSDLDVIRAIEKQINEPLSLCELEAVMSGNSRCSYVLDQQEQVIALNLQNSKQTDLVLLKKLKNLSRLNLSLNQINNLTALKELAQLTQLNVQKNLISDLAPLKGLSNLNLLNLQDNQIVELKPLKELNNLRVLNVQANQVSALKALTGLTELTALNLSSNLIKELSALKSLKQLNLLNLSSNQLIGIEPLQELAGLIELDLRFNQISKLEPLTNLKKLSRLYLSSNKITELEALQQLSELSQLFLSSNQIIDISPLAKLNVLTELDLRANQISQIAALANLKHLQWLYLENNQINDITPLAKLTELIQLNLRNNQISNIEALKNLKKLNQLYLSNNKIQLLPKWLLDFNLKIKWNSGGDGISVIANPVKYPPPEIIRQGNTAIKGYFDALERQQQRPLNAVKICFVGDSGVGKTSLRKLLCGEVFDPHQPVTPGISVVNWQLQKLLLHCWDFGGDPQIQPTHSLFFSAQALYVLVLDNRSQRHEEYWIKKIEYLAGSVPILIVLNKCEEAGSYDVNRRDLLKSYNGLQNGCFFSVSCAQGLGIAEFKQGLIAALKQLPVLKKMWPESWIQAKNVIEQQLQQQHYISAQRYTEICQQHAIKEAADQQQLVELLNDLGVFVHFKKFACAETYIFSANWLIQSLYKILSSSLLLENKGVLLIKELAVILKSDSEYRYAIEHYRDLINLIRQLELGFLIEKTHILIPQALEIDEPEINFAASNLLRFRMHYEYLDEAVIARFIVALRADIADKKCWRNGVVLQNSHFNSGAVVKVDYTEHTIAIQVNGEQSRAYFAVLSKALHDIENTLLT